MEQRSEPSIEPELTVGTDPADVPGLLGPRPTGTEPADAKQAGLKKADRKAEREWTEEREPDEPDEAEREETEEREKREKKEKREKTEEADEGPVFEVSDRRGTILADRSGILFRLDDQEAEFPWHEIGAVEIRLPRLGRWFTVEVHLLNHRWFNADVEAKARSDLKRWEAELDAVLVAYVEDT